MKKLSVLFIAVACTVAFCAPAFADDRVSFYGSMRVEMHDRTSFADSDSSSWDQRFRLGTKIRVSDSVYAEMRADYSEAQWGTSGYSKNWRSNPDGLIVRPENATGGGSTNMHLDRAFLNISKEKWAVRAGLQYMSFGVLQVLDANPTGIKFDLKLDPVKVSLLYAKMDENGSTNDDGDLDDTDFYGANVNYSADAFSVNAFIGAVEDSTSEDNSPMAFGVQGKANLGMVDLTGEIATFSGDHGAVDYMGTQVYVDAVAKVTDMISIEGQLMYAVGTTDADEDQITYLADWGSFTPLEANTPFDGWYTYVNSGTADPFDPTGDNAGIQGILLGAKFVPMEDLSLGGKVAYFEPEEDDATSVEDFTSFIVWASYNLATNTTLAAMYQQTDPSVEGTHGTYTDGDAEQIFYGKLQVSF